MNEEAAPVHPFKFQKVVYNIFFCAIISKVVSIFGEVPPSGIKKFPETGLKTTRIV